MNFGDMKWQHIEEHLNDGGAFAAEDHSDGSRYSARKVMGETGNVYVIVRYSDGSLEVVATGRLTELVDLMEQNFAVKEWKAQD